MADGRSRFDDSRHVETPLCDLCVVLGKRVEIVVVGHRPRRHVGRNTPEVGDDLVDERRIVGADRRYQRDHGFCTEGGLRRPHGGDVGTDQLPRLEDPGIAGHQVDPTIDASSSARKWVKPCVFLLAITSAPVRPARSECRGNVLLKNHEFESQLPLSGTAAEGRRRTAPNSRRSASATAADRRAHHRCLRAGSRGI